MTDVLGSGLDWPSCGHAMTHKSLLSPLPLPPKQVTSCPMLVGDIWDEWLWKFASVSTCVNTILSPFKTGDPGAGQ